jgi:hypothetical protein
MPVYYPPSILSDIRVMDLLLLMKEESISTGQGLQEYLHSFRRTYKKPVEGGLILSLFIAQMNFIKMLQGHRQNLAILTG